MKLFVSKVFSFIAPILILGLFFEIILRSIPNDYVEKNKEIRTNSDSIRTLILGSSHAFRGINPNYLNENAYNLAGVSQSLDIDFKLFKKYRGSLPSLKNLIVPISYFTFYNQLKDSEESWRMKDYKIYYDLDVELEFNQRFEILSNDLKINLIRIFRYFMGTSTLSSNSKGFGPFPLKHKPNINWEEDGKLASNRHTLRDSSHMIEHLNYLDKIIQYCSHRDIKVLLISIPVYQSYLDNLELNQYEATISMADSIANNHTNSTYINKFDDKRFTREHFYNSDHLNLEGAQIFSLMIKNHLQ